MSFSTAKVQPFFLAISFALMNTAASGEQFSGLKHVKLAPKIAPATNNELVTLLPSPTSATLTPLILPKCSLMAK